MADSPTALRQASFRNIEFDYFDTSDTFKKRLATHAIPHRDGAVIEDMGLAPREFTVRACFWGAAYPSLKPFLLALKQVGSGEFQHPMFGKFNAYPKTINVKHNELRDKADVDITFMEETSLPSTTTATSAAAITEHSKELATATTLRTAALLLATLPANVPTTGIGIAGYMASIGSLASSVRQKVGNIHSAIGKAKGLVAAGLSPFKILSSALSYGTSLPGVVLSTFTGTLESIAALHISAAPSPSRFADSYHSSATSATSDMGNFSTSGQEDTTGEVLKAAWKTCHASTLTVVVALELSIDAAIDSNNTPPADAPASATDRTELLTAIQIERLTATVRTVINEAIAINIAVHGHDAAPLVENLKAEALWIQQVGDGIRLRRENIRPYKLPKAMSLMELAFYIYGDMAFATKLLRINTLPDVNFLPANSEVLIYDR